MLPDFVRIFVARHVISRTDPSWLPTVIQWPTRNGFSIWMASPANALPSVSCKAKPMTAATMADVVRNSRVRERDDGGHRDEERDDRVLHDGGRPLGLVDARPRIERQRDERLRRGEHEQQRLDLPARARGRAERRATTRARRAPLTR